MKERIYQIRKSLAAAFGGYSQYSNQNLGEAIAGQIINNGLDFPIPNLCGEAARQECERWEDQEWADDPGSVAASIEAACRAALERCGVWHDGLLPLPQPAPSLRRNRDERRPRGERSV